MAFVLDASVAAGWALADEPSPLAELAAHRLKDEIALAPRIWWYEVRNLLVINERRQRITASESAAFLELLASHPIQIDAVDDEEANFRFARRYRLSFYDAAHLALAAREGLPLATLDTALQSAAVSAGVALLA